MRKLLFVLCLLAITSSCATIISESNYPVSISSNPSGAQISIMDQSGRSIFSGTTPTTVVLKAGDGYFSGADYTVSFKQEGYASHTAQIKRGIDGWYLAGNLVFGGLIGWLIVDPISGAMWTLSNLHSELQPLVGNTGDNGMKIISLNDLPKHLHSSLVPVN